MSKSLNSIAISTISGDQTTVSAPAAGWIAGVLREVQMPLSVPLLQAIEESSQLRLSTLTVKQLKKISQEMSTRTIQFHNNNLSGSENPVYFAPKSGAKKTEWVNTIASFLNEHALNNNIYNILNGTATSSSTTTALVLKNSPRASGRKYPKATSNRSSVASAKKPSAAKANKKSLAKANMSKKSPSKSKFTLSSSSSAALAADEAMARSLQMQEDIRGNGFQPWGGPLANSYLENHNGHGSTSGRYPLVSGSKRPANFIDSPKPKHVPALVKSEPLPRTSTSYAANSIATASVATSGAAECPLQPNGARESNMMSNLREMGFTNNQEILAALRAVAAEREEASIAAASYGVGSGWSAEEEVEAAMMWIVTQREEAAEAQKLDEARISSELADAAMEQSRKQQMEQDLKNANLLDLLGSLEDDDSAQITSRYFPCSVLLRNRSVIRVMNMVAADAAILGKDQVIRLLSLEKKARKWYGTVLPFSYFQYVLCPLFGCWEKELRQNITPSSRIRCSLIHESDKLERAMFNLSEQEEGGVGSVPKLFLAAQRNASQLGKATSDVAINAGNDDEVLLLPERVGRPQASLRNAQAPANKSLDVIELI